MTTRFGCWIDLRRSGYSFCEGVVSGRWPVNWFGLNASNFGVLVEGWVEGEGISCRDPSRVGVKVSYLSGLWFLLSLLVWILGFSGKGCWCSWLAGKMWLIFGTGTTSKEVVLVVLPAEKLGGRPLGDEDKFFFRFTLCMLLTFQQEAQMALLMLMNKPPTPHLWRCKHTQAPALPQVY